MYIISIVLKNRIILKRFDCFLRAPEHGDNS